jgi:hypothetical protein
LKTRNPIVEPIFILAVTLLVLIAMDGDTVNKKTKSSASIKVIELKIERQLEQRPSVKSLIGETLEIAKSIKVNQVQDAQLESIKDELLLIRNLQDNEQIKYQF